MRVNLRAVVHTVTADAKSKYGVVQVLLPLAAFERQSFAQGRLVDLNDADAGGFEVKHFGT